MTGLSLVNLATDARGNVDLDGLRSRLSGRTAGLMLTNPSTLGLFDEGIEEITRLVHEAGGLCYYDGANLNAVCGISRPGDMGFDIVHFNLHKTFSQPHGGGGPGGGPIAVRELLEPFLPSPVLVRTEDGLRPRRGPAEIGRQGARASSGRSGSSCVPTPTSASTALGCARCRRRPSSTRTTCSPELRDDYDLPYDRLCMHEFVLSARSSEARARRHRARHREAADGLRRITRRPSTSRSSCPKR